MMDPWFENFKLLLTYWLMSTNRDNMSEAASAVSALLSYGQQQVPPPQPPPPGRPPYSMSSIGGMSLPVDTPSSASQYPRNPQDLSMPHPADNPDLSADDPQLSSSDQPFMEVNSTIHPDRTHICPNCNKGFKSKQQLAQHSLVHTGIRRHICSFCDKGFKQLCHLQQHLRIHTGEKPYRCCFDGCDRAFAQMANLHHHMRNHEDHVKKAANKQYQCSVCSRAYTNESSLKNHTLKMHVNVRSLEAPYPLPYKPRKPRQSSTNNSMVTKEKDFPTSTRGSSVPLSFVSDPRASNFSRFVDLHKETLSRPMDSNQLSPNMAAEQSNNISSTTILPSSHHMQTPLIPSHHLPPLSLMPTNVPPSLMSPSFISHLQQAVQSSSGHANHLMSSTRPTPQEIRSSPLPQPPTSSSSRVTPTSQDQRSTPQETLSSQTNRDSSTPHKEAAEPATSLGVPYNPPLPHPFTVPQTSLPLSLPSRLNSHFNCLLKTSPAHVDFS
ncbi:zinc finger protein 628-like [Saccostrea echinata]|uniref:zinc finger protein 628-like n=1 Tax=Saccostrea echinata TaxID=191078 RepID=UPI002A81E7EC|nr:zinc finger protein 628-like [Saccostrea echinata]